MPKTTSDDRTLLIECMQEFLDLRHQVTRWASIMQSMGYMELAGQTDALSDYGDFVHTDILMRMRNMPPVRIYEDDGMSQWVKTEPDSYT